MHTNHPAKLALAASLAGLLAACGHQVQTTSGSQYLAAYESGAPGGRASATDAEIAVAANVEPQLRFPARLGLARIGHQGLTAVPPAEAESWRALAQRLGSGYGAFVPVSPLIAALATPEPSRLVFTNDMFPEFRTSLAEVVREVRLGAARQHLDAVLLYETFGRSEETSNPLAVTKLALIGFFLPTEDVEAEGFAQAVLVDVRNGYTYGTASARSERPTYRLSTSGNSYAVQREAQADAQARAVENLTGEIEAMVRELRLALAEGRVAGDAR
ncbi:MAG: hypothetical protein GEU89_12160 [Kiloniellaceae bacterium]|nr:hypothetical protein [Kiloniellaceae bacterium]